MTSLPSFLGRDRSDGWGGGVGVSGILLETVGEGLVPQGWELKSKRKMLTDRLSRRGRGGKRQAMRAEGGPRSLSHFLKEKRKGLPVSPPGHWGQGRLRGRKSESQPTVLHPRLIFPRKMCAPSLHC